MHIIPRVPWLIFSVALAFLVSACSDCSWSSFKAQVIMDSRVDIRLPAPVTLDGATIGKVVSMEDDGSGRMGLNLCLNSDARDSLTRFTAFYLKAAPAEDVLICEILAPGPLPEDKDLVFPGFSEYASFFAWRAENVFKEGMEDVLKLLEGAIQQ